MEKVAAKNGWKINPDKELADAVIEGLYSNYKEYGYFSCPCRESWGERSKDRDIICPCNYSTDDIDEFGHCFCALYISDTFFASKQEASSIPERRPSKLFP